MLVGGDVKVIRLWDAPREVCVMDIPARSGSCVTSLTAEQVAGHIFVAGFGDGAIRVYDRRLPPRDSMVKVWKNHEKAWVVNVHMQRGGERELVSGTVMGDVKLWDIRLNQPYKSFQAHRGGMRSLSVHEHAPVIATYVFVIFFLLVIVPTNKFSGSVHQEVKIWNTNTNMSTPLNTFRPSSTGFMHHARTSPVKALSFHPHRMMLAASVDQYICGYYCDRNGDI